jgi:solute carrier family 13 (sodium-dependent dicarboxylate transporter), member 2/3/5
MTTNGAPAASVRWLPLALGPVLFLAGLGTTAVGVPAEGARVAGVMLWMGAWWVTEVVPLAATSLLPIVLFPAFGVRTTAQATAPYANELIFLFLAGFLLAQALECWNSHARIAYRLIEAIGTGTRRIVLGVMVATAFLSLWISNTAATAMMFPIVMAIGGLFGTDEQGARARASLLLGLAFAASIGGMGTLIGTPPNLIMAAAIKQTTGTALDFGHFILLGMPVVLVLLPLTWAVLVAGIPRGSHGLDGSAQAIIAARRAALGPLRGGERRVLGIFVATAIAWVVREPKDLGFMTLPGLTSFIPGLTDAGVGIAAAVLLFVLPGRAPDGERRPLLRWEEASRIPWDVLLLFGGGLSLASAMESSGLSTWLAGRLSGLAGLPLPVIVAGIAIMVVFLGELASNTAMAAMMMPLSAALAAGLGQPPAFLMLVAGFSASLGFALPIATPPNAIVFGSGQIPVRRMLRMGLLVDCMGIVIVSIVLTLLAPSVLGLR